MSDDNIRVFPGALPPITGGRQNVLCKMLSDMLEMAESGRLQCLFATGFMADGDRITARGGHHTNIYEVVGAIEWLKVEFASKVINDQQGKV